MEDDDLNTTAPQSKPEAWKMPEPVFRRTSGKLPQGVVKDPSPSGEVSVPPEAPAPAASSNPSPEPVVKPKSSILKLLLVFLGLGAMIAFLVVFLTVIYFFFLRTGE